MQTKDRDVTLYAQQILSQVRQVVVGKDPVLLWVLAAILARGHILLEDIPGVGKTTMALAFYRVLDLQYNRVQFTPDVLPSDVTGFSIPDAQGEGMRYQPGAVLCNLFLADELNRATSRTQSALLEAMEEGQVTVDGVSHALPQPFVVIATQNPTGAAGTQLLPDSQMDRFMIRLSLGYPSPKDEAAMILNRQGGNPLNALAPLMTREELIAIKEGEPTVEEIAQRLGEKKEAVLHAMDAIVEPISLYEPVYNDNGDALYLMDQLSDTSSGDEGWLENIVLKEALNQLSERERKIIQLRFYRNKTQMEIASEIGISQAQVSRLEKAALEKMRKQM